MCFLGWWSIIQNKLQQRKKKREKRTRSWLMNMSGPSTIKAYLIPFVIVVYIFFITIKSYFMCAY